jgi:hypothetical protein
MEVVAGTARLAVVNDDCRLAEEGTATDLGPEPPPGSPQRPKQRSLLDFME